MLIKKQIDVPSVAMDGLEKVRKQIVIGPDDGSNEIVLRYFSLEPGASSPRHAHDFPHLVRIEAGNGVITDETGTHHPLQKEDFVFIRDNEVHNFRNSGSEPFEFICIVPRRGEA